MRNVPTELVILEIAESLRRLIGNPDLSKIIKDAYALSEDEKAKSEEAKKIIARADQLFASLEEKEKAYSDIDTRIAKAKEAETVNEKTLFVIKHRQAEIDRLAKENSKNALENKKENDRLEMFKSALDSRAEQIKASEEKATRVKENMKKRAANAQAELAKAEEEALAL